MNFSSFKPNREHLISNWPKYWFWSILLVAFVAIILTFDDYGITWDEFPQSRYAELVLDYFQSGFNDNRYGSFFDLKYYGALFEVIPTIIYRFVGEWKFEIRHFCIALTALLTIAGVMKYSSLFSDPFVPFFASLSLIMLPRFYGHAFNNSKDVPFACFFVWAIYAIARLLHKKTFFWREIMCVGLAVGLALATRTGGFLLFFFLAAEGIFLMVNRSLSKNLLWAFQAKKLFKPMSVIAVAWIVMVSLWPWAHENVIMNPLLALKMITNFHVTYPVFFEGKFIFSNLLPGYYLPKYLLITTPPILLVCFFFGVGRSIYEVVQHFKSNDSFLYFTTLIWFFIPVTLFIIERPNVYDGIRHFLFILPAMAVFAGIGAAFISKTITVRHRIITYSLMTVLILSTVIDIVRLHPYQMTYFNSFVGGLKEAGKKFETDYWTSSYKEAIEWVNENTNPNQGTTNVLVAANISNRLSAEYYRAPHVKIFTVFAKVLNDSLPSKMDYYISTTRYGFNQNFPDAPVVHTISRDSAIFSVIKKRKK